MEQNINNRGMMNNQSTSEDELDLLELGYALWKKIWLIIICFVIGAAIAGAGTKFLVTPKYRSYSQIYVYSQETAQNNYQATQIGTALKVDFQVIATTRDILEKVISNLNLNLTYESLKGKVSVSNPENSRILQFNVTDTDPQRAADISNELARVLSIWISNTMGSDQPSIVEHAVAAKSPFSPSIKKNAVIGGLGMAFLCMAIIVITVLMDDTIKSEDDVEKYLHYNVLAAIPEDSNLANADSKKRKGKKNKKAAKAKKA